ncbi:MAG: peptidase C39 family protein [archaeon]
MKLNIPFRKSEIDTECAQRCLQMVLEYFEQKHSIKELSKLTKQLPSGMTWTAGIARASKILGFETKIISKTNFSHDENEIKYYKEHAKEMKTLYNLIKKNKKLKISTEEENLSINQLIKLLTKNSIPIILINWNTLIQKENYQGHFVVLSGYDNKNIYIHNPGIAKAQPFMKIKKELFKKAWESKGTDKDIVLISKPKI